MLFTKKGKKLIRVEEERFELESDLQHMIEQNMDSLFEIDFIKSELSIEGFRIDTVGFDKGTKSFVIVEYKRGKNQSVIDQGMAYLQRLRANKAEFILAYNEIFTKSIRKEDIDWSRSRIIFIARCFTAHQKQASESKDLPIDLYEIRKYKNGMILLNPVTTKSTKSINTVNRKKQKDTLSQEIKTYTEEDHLSTVTPKTRDLYSKIKQIMESLDDNISIVPKKMAIMFKKERGFVWVVLRKNSIEITFNAKPDSIDDPKKIIQDVTNIGHWGGGNNRIKVSTESELSYVRGLLDQVYSQLS